LPDESDGRCVGPRAAAIGGSAPALGGPCHAARSHLAFVMGTHDAQNANGPASESGTALDPSTAACPKSPHVANCHNRPLAPSKLMTLDSPGAAHGHRSAGVLGVTEVREHHGRILGDWWRSVQIRLPRRSPTHRDPPR
jgi:hypothetical protein